MFGVDLQMCQFDEWSLLIEGKLTGWYIYKQVKE